MTRARVLSLIAAGVVTALTVGCSSSSDEPSADAPVVLQGAYLPKAASGETAMSGIVFAGTHYVLRTRECADVRCEERGSFAIDSQNHLLNLVVDGSGRSYSLPFQVLATREQKGASAGGVKAAALGGVLRPTDSTLVKEPGTIVVNESVSLTVAVDVQLSGQDFSAENEAGLCGDPTVYNGTGSHKTRTYLGNERDRRNVGNAACTKAKEDAEKKCKSSPWVCTATASGTVALEPDCEGVLEISCTCSATTKCKYEWVSPI
jgi:hypothetical protein